MNNANPRGAAAIGRLSTLAVLVAAGLVAAHPAFAEGWSATATKAHDPRGARHVGPLASAADVQVVVSLKLRDKAALDALTAKLLAGSRDAQPLTPARFLAQHAPTAAQADAVVAYLLAQGFRNIEVADNRLLVSATGSAGAVQRAFRAELHAYDVDGRSAFANVTDAQVPEHLADTVLAVVGLQTVHTAHVALRALAASAKPLASTQTVSGIYPQDFATLYGAASLPSASNATIGIIAQGSLTQTIADLKTFANVAGYPVPSVTTTVVGSASADTTNLVEWNLDSQDALAAAGGTIKSMIFYDVPTLTDAALTQCYNKAVTDNKARAINVSLGICETAEPASVIAADDQIFQSAVAQGQMFSVSSGDSGAYECSSSSTTAGQSYPATSPYVIAVGGTTLNRSGTSYVSESVWSGAGGGPSVVEWAPSWQLSAGINSSARRSIPDISFDADPASGALVLVNGAYQQWGGTSLAAPLWAGFWSRIQSQSANALPFPGQTLYAGAATHASWFHDIVSGSQGYAATTGWDYASGYGSLVVGNFATAFASGTAQGTFSYFSGSHTALDSGGDVASLTVKNVGAGSITGIGYTCGYTSSATGSWHQWNGSTAPTSLAAGASGVYQCKAEGSGMNQVYVKLTGTNATNSPFAVTF